MSKTGDYPTILNPLPILSLTMGKGKVLTLSIEHLSNTSSYSQLRPSEIKNSKKNIAYFTHLF